MSHNSCINHKCYWAIRAMADMQLLEDGRLHDGTHNGVHAGAVPAGGEDSDLHPRLLREARRRCHDTVSKPQEEGNDKR